MGAGLQQCTVLERKIRAAAQEGKTAFHPELRQLRNELRAACEAALFEDYPRTQRHELEQLLWKSVFYRPIEEFRRRIKEHSAQSSRNEDLLAKTRTAFGMYLAEASSFYLRLAARLQEAFGDVGFAEEASAGSAAAGAAQQAQQAAVQQARCDCRASVYRCLICLGDLARYQVGNCEPHQRDWSDCRRRYLQAALVYPQGGNSYNQLAVLATYAHDELAAAFYYLRALNVPSPFVVARENLVTMLDSNRASHAKLVAAGPAGGAGGRAPPRGTRPAATLERELKIRWVRVLGVLHIKLDLDAFPELLAAALADLDEYLHRLKGQRGHSSATSSSGGGAGDASSTGDLDSPPLLLMLALCLMGIAHSALAEQAQHASAGASYADSLQRSVARGYALTAMAEVAARLAEAGAATTVAAAAAVAAGAVHAAPAAAAAELLPPLWALLLWMSGPVPAGSGALVPGTAASSGGSSAEGAAEQSMQLQAALQRFWAAAAQLVVAVAQLPAARSSGVGRQQGGSEPQRATEEGGEGGEAALAGAALAGAGQLAEDLHCWCYAPLGLTDSVHSRAGAGGAASGHSAGAAAAPGKALQLRAQRLLAAARALAAALGPQGAIRAQGLVTTSGDGNDPLGSFLAAVANADSSSGGSVAAGQQQQAVAQEQEQLQQVQQAQQAQEQPPPQQNARPPQAAPGGGMAGAEMEEEEEEEVILFSPAIHTAAKAAQVQGRATAAPPAKALSGAPLGAGTQQQPAAPAGATWEGGSSLFYSLFGGGGGGSNGGTGTSAAGTSAAGAPQQFSAQPAGQLELVAPQRPPSLPAQQEAQQAEQQPAEGLRAFLGLPSSSAAHPLPPHQLQPPLQLPPHQPQQHQPGGVAGAPSYYGRQQQSHFQAPIGPYSVQQPQALQQHQQQGGQAGQGLQPMQLNALRALAMGQQPHAPPQQQQQQQQQQHSPSGTGAASGPGFAAFSSGYGSAGTAQQASALASLAGQHYGADHLANQHGAAAADWGAPAQGSLFGGGPGMGSGFGGLQANPQQPQQQQLPPLASLGLVTGSGASGSLFGTGGPAVGSAGGSGSGDAFGYLSGGGGLASGSGQQQQQQQQQHYWQ